MPREKKAQRATPITKAGAGPRGTAAGAKTSSPGSTTKSGKKAASTKKAAGTGKAAAATTTTTPRRSGTGARAAQAKTPAATEKTTTTERMKTPSRNRMDPAPVEMAATPRRTKAGAAKTTKTSGATKKAETAKQAETAKKAGAAQQAASTKKAGAAKQPESVKKADAARRAETPKKTGAAKQAETAKKAAAAKQAEAAKKAGAAKQAESGKKAAAAKQSASGKKAAAAKQSASGKKAAAAKQSESAKKAAAAKQAASAKKAEPARKAKAEAAPAAPDAIEAPRHPPVDVEQIPPTPIVEVVEGKGRHAMVDPLAVADQLGDAVEVAAAPEAPLEPWEIELEQARERRLAEKARRARERAQRHADRRAERKLARQAARGGGVVVAGTITVRPEGYGFLRRTEGPPGDDVFLPPNELQGVMDGDTLRVRLVKGRHGRDAGELLEVLDRRRRHLVGTYYRRGRTTWVVPVDPTLPRFVSVRASPDIREGQVVKVEITRYPTSDDPLLGDVVKVVGEPGDPLVEVLEVAYAHGFAEDFPPEVRAEAKRLPDRVLDEERQGRRDLRDLPLVTIDGADARDFDDAVHVQQLPRGQWRLVVAIADVAHYVREGSRLDEEALHRATSVYFPNHVLPMLPERLSNGICSLNPGEDRLCMVADVRFDRSGRPLGAEVYEGVMHSHARCTYEQVAHILEGGSEPELDHVRDDLVRAGKLASLLRARRVERGALDFDLPEVKPVLDEKMRVVDLVKRPRNEAHRLIEEFMLAANEAVARYFDERELPTIYRVHGDPDPEKLQLFVTLAHATGFFFELDEEGITPVKLGGWLRQIEGSPQQHALNTLLLRAMMQAVYTPENIGHFGLGAEHYLHFTSPIRRYPDLMVHRLIKAHQARGGRSPKGAAVEEMEESLEEIALQCSTRERAAMEAERDIDAYFKCLFAEEHVGEEHDATIVGITDFGFFAQVHEFPIEGLVRADELGTDWDLDPERHRLVFGSGFSFGIGETVRVVIAGVDRERRQIHFGLLVDAAGDAVVQTGWRQRQRPVAAMPRWVEAPPRERDKRARRGYVPAGTSLTGSLDRLRGGRVPGGRDFAPAGPPTRGPGGRDFAPAGPPPRGAPSDARRPASRFAAGDRRAGWSGAPQGRFAAPAPQGRFATPAPWGGATEVDDSPRGKKKKGTKSKPQGRKGKQRPGKRERQTRRR